MKKSLIYSFTIFLWAAKSFGQVNLVSGAPQLSFPIYNYSNEKNRLSTSIELVYIGGNGIKVNDEASEMGLGWTLKAGGQVTRIRMGEADDQIAVDLNNETHIRNGLMNKPTSIPTNSVNKYMWSPTYPRGMNHTFYDPLVHFDTEHDEFIFSFDNKSGKFLVNADKTNSSTLMFEKSGIVIKTIHEDLWLGMRGSIRGFIATDENGIEYKFYNPMLNSLLTYVKSKWSANINGNWNIIMNSPDADAAPRNLYEIDPSMYEGNRSFEIFVPKKTGYKIANAWLLSEIINPLTNEKIIFNYENRLHESNQEVAATWTLTDVLNENGSGVSFSYGFNVTESFESADMPELQSITLPENKRLDFIYTTVRKDIVGRKALDEIKYFEDNQMVNKFKFSYGYFYKWGVVGTGNVPAGTRNTEIALCLNSFQKIGFDNTADPAIKFEYYTGVTGIDQLQFRERFSFLKDHWGYNNVGSTGLGALVFNASDHKINLVKLKEYVMGDLSLNRIPTTDVDMLQLGLLKEWQNEYGGKTRYNYETNMALHNGVEKLSGGVRVKEVIESDPVTLAVLKKAYAYRLENGSSSGYGFETMNYKSTDHAVWVVPSDDNNYRDYAPFLNNIVQGAISPSYLTRTASAPGMIISAIPSIIADPGKGLKNLTITSALTIAGKLYPPLGMAYALFGSLQGAGLFSTSAYNKYILHMYSQATQPVNSLNFLPAGYSRVEEAVYGIKTPGGTEMNAGKKVFEFYSSTETPYLIPDLAFPYPARQRALNWAYGLPKKMTVYGLQGKVSEEEYIYDVVSETNLSADYSSEKKGVSWSLISPDRPGHYDFYHFSGFVSPDNLPHRITYNPIIGKSYLKTIKEKEFDVQGNFVEKIKQLEYNSLNHLPKSERTTDGKGNTIETRNYFSIDYSGLPVYATMAQKNMVDAVVSNETWLIKPNNDKFLLSLSVSDYGITPRGDYRPLKTHRLVTDRPVAENIIGTFNPTSLVRNTSLIKEKIQSKYNYSGNMYESKDVAGDRVKSTIYDMDNKNSIASITNAMQSEVAYSSFEYLDVNILYYGGNWHALNVVTREEDFLSPTGKYCLKLDNTSGVYSNIPKTKNYTLSFWASSANFQVNGVSTSPTASGPTYNGWTYYEFNIPQGAPELTTITGNCRIDELRLYPKNATMVSCTIEKGNKTSECDINNRIIYFEYDGLGRKVSEKDEKRNLIKTYEYHFTNQ